MPVYTIGIVGLGRMGGNMAQNLLESGHEIVGFDVSNEAITDFENAGGESLETPTAVASAADVLITSLPNPSIVSEVYTDENGVIEGDVTDTVAIEMSTIDPETTLDVADAAAEVGLDVLGAPVSGGPEDCARGTLTIMAGGEETVFEREEVQTVLDTLGEKVYHTGNVDSGHTLKLLNNTMSMGNLLLSMETVSLGAERGVDGEVLMEVLSNAGGASNQFKKRIPRVLNRNFEAGFTIDFGKKDVGLALDTAEQMERPMFFGSLVHNLYTEASARGYGQEDIGAVVKLYEELQDEIVDADSEVDETFEGY